MATKNGKWIHVFEDYLDRFGLVKFAETNSLNMFDFERSLKHYVGILKSKIGSQFQEHKFGEIDNESINDFTDSFKKFFS